MDFSKEPAIPTQEKGQQSDIVEKMDVSDTSQAKAFFSDAKSRLFNISDWDSVSEGMSARFTLADQFGNAKYGPPEVGDYIRINIPGPGSSAGDGYDWVRIELVQEESDIDRDLEIIKVRPAPDPKKQEGTAHFFDSSATSSFVIKREGRFIFAEIHGRNEEPNIESKKLTDKVRNLLVGTAATIGLAKIQWQKLAKGLLNFQSPR